MQAFLASLTLLVLLIVQLQAVSFHLPISTRKCLKEEIHKVCSRTPVPYDRLVRINVYLSLGYAGDRRL